MRLSLYTLHSRGGVNEILAVPDRIRFLGLLPPVWAIWRGLWLTLIGMTAAIIASGLVHPALPAIVWSGLSAIVFFEGAALERFELGLRGWRELGVVEAASEAGAEEAYLTGAGT